VEEDDPHVAVVDLAEAALERGNVVGGDRVHAPQDRLAEVRERGVREAADASSA
jgi:hypothetical protein